MSTHPTMLWLLLLAISTQSQVFGADDDNKAVQKLDRMNKELQDQMIVTQSMMVHLIEGNAKMSDTLARFDKILSQNDETKTQISGISAKLDQLEKKVEDVQIQIEKNQNLTKLSISDCQRWIQWASINATESFATSSGNRFYFKKNSLTWVATRNWCMQKGMQLAIVKELSEMAQVTKELNNRGYDSHGVWLEASDIGRTSGRFYWGDGTQVDNATWMMGQPDKFDAATSACVYIHSASNTAGLKDWQCSGVSNTLCQLPAALRPCLA